MRGSWVIGLVAVALTTLTTLTILTTLVGLLPSALADQSLHATGELSTGFSSNVLGVPETDETRVEADAFASITPGALFTYEAPRYRTQVRYSLSARLFARRSEANSFSNVLAVGASADPSPTTNIEVALTGAAGRVNAFDRTSSESSVGQTPNGDVAYARTLGSLFFTKQLSYLWRVRASMGGAAFTPTDETVTVNTNWNYGGTVAIDRSWRTHQLNAQFEAKYVHNERISPDTGERIDPDLQIHLGPRVRWLWDISGSFSSALSLGVLRVYDPEDYSQGLYQPDINARISFLKERSIVSLRFLHGVTTNSLVGQSSTVDRVELRGNYPLTEILKDAGLTGSIGYQHARLIDVGSSALTSSSDQGGLDLAANWRQYEGLSWNLRYQFSKQTRGVAVLGSTEDTSRHQVTVGLSVRYPDRQAVELPERSEERVDQANEEELFPEERGGSQ